MHWTCPYPHSPSFATFKLVVTKHLGILKYKIRCHGLISRQRLNIGSLCGSKWDMWKEGLDTTTTSLYLPVPSVNRIKALLWVIYSQHSSIRAYTKKLLLWHRFQANGLLFWEYLKTQKNVMKTKNPYILNELIINWWPDLKWKRPLAFCRRSKRYLPKLPLHCNR